MALNGKLAVVLTLDTMTRIHLLGCTFNFKISQQPGQPLERILRNVIDPCYSFVNFFLKNKKKVNNEFVNASDILKNEFNEIHKRTCR